MSHKDSAEMSLQSTDNYNQTLINDKKEILIQFLNTLCTYLENVKVSKIRNLFYIVRGIETIFHVFTLILTRTKNVKTAVLNAHKAFYLYIEFCEQIADESNMVLQLSSREAVLYVYKKTIFELLPSEPANLNHVYDQLLLMKALIELSISAKRDVDFMKNYSYKIIQLNLEAEEAKSILDLANEEKFTDFLEAIKKRKPKKL